MRVWRVSSDRRFKNGMQTENFVNFGFCSNIEY